MEDRQDGVIVAPTFTALEYTKFELEGLQILRGFDLLDQKKSRDRRFVSAAINERLGAHFTCHGRIEGEEEDVVLVLGDEIQSATSRFRLDDAQAITYRSRQEVFIAACSARVPKSKVPDEVIGFPNAFLSKGYRAVISAGWPVGDLVAALTVLRYHSLRRDMTNSPVKALCEAQRWLRVQTYASAADFIQEIIEEAKQQGRQSEHLEAALAMMREKAARWSKPRKLVNNELEWGAFALIGN